MFVFLVDRKAVTLTIHRDNCPLVRGDPTHECACRGLDDNSDPSCLCADHFRIAEVDRMMAGRFYALLLCETCLNSPNPSYPHNP